MTVPSASVVARLGRSTRWERRGAVRVRTEVGHPQGLTRWGAHWLASTVHGAPLAGELLVVDAAGRVVDRVDVTDGDRFHPGGIAATDSGCWVPVAEYVPDSTTAVLHVAPDLVATSAFVFDDHLGAICPLADGSLLAVSWGSRSLYRLDHDGRVLARRSNPSWFVDVQDLTVLDDGNVVATGVGGLHTPAGSVQLGGLLVIDVDTLAFGVQTPVQAWLASGRVATYNGVHVDTDGGTVRLHVLADDDLADIETWTATTTPA